MTGNGGIMPVSYSSSEPPCLAVDVLTEPDRSLTVAWAHAPGCHRQVDGSRVERIDALARNVARYESRRSGVQRELARARLQLGEELYSLLDGPDRLLTRKRELAAGKGAALELAIRLLCPCCKPAAGHPAATWRWELLADDSGHLAVARDPGLILAVQLGDRDSRAVRTLPRGGLRILFMAYSPDDMEPALDHEREEEHVLATLAPFVRDGRAQVRVVEFGSLKELERCLLEGDYDIVHLSGHGAQTDDGPRLIMENELGERAPASPREILEVLQRASRMPELLLISSCHSAGSRDGIPSFAAQLVAGDVSSVIGWVQPVRDDLATQAAADIYQRLCTGATPAQAVAFARARLHGADLRSRRPSHAWATLHLITREAAGFRIDRSGPSLAAETGEAQETYRYLDQQGRMRVLERGFVGRRRPLKRLISILLRGEDHRDGTSRHAGAVILGMKGMGKSCLAARALERASQELDEPSKLGFVVLHGALHDGLVYQQLEALALRWDDLRARQILHDPAGGQTLAQRIRRLLANHWRRRQLVVVLDDFEQNLETQPQGPAHLSPYAAELLEVLVPACLTGRPKLLITTTATFVSPEPVARSLAQIRLGPLEPSSIRKLWNRGQRGKGDAPGDLARFSPDAWADLCERFGRNPRILEWTRMLLSGKTPREVEAVVRNVAETMPALTSGAVPSEREQAELARVYLQGMAYDAAIARLSRDMRTFIKRARVFETAVPIRALEPFTEGLDVNLADHIPALQNMGLLEAGELDGQPGCRVSPLIEPKVDVDDPERWHGRAAELWAAEGLRGNRHDWMQRALEHAWRARHEQVATQMARYIDSWLNNAGLYTENLALAEQNLQVFPESHVALAWAGDTAHKFGDSVRGWELYEKAEQAAERRGISGRERSRMLLECAGILHSLGRHDDARARLVRAIAIEESIGVEANINFAKCLHALAGVLGAQGKVQAAREHLERSLAIYTRSDGMREHPDVTSSLDALAGLLQALGDLQGSREALERSLAMKTRIFESQDHPSIAASLHQLSRVLAAMGDLPSAREAVERSLAIKARVLNAPDHPSIAASLHQRAEVLLAQGDSSGAKEQLERSIAMKIKVFKTRNHPDVAASLHNLGNILESEGKDGEAIDTYSQVLQIEKKCFGNLDQYHSAETEISLARLLLGGGQELRGLSLLTHAHSVLATQFPDHRDLERIREELTRIFAHVFALAAIALNARSGDQLSLEERARLRHGLDALSAAGEPFESVASFLRAVGNGVEIPDELSKEVVVFLIALRDMAGDPDNDDDPQ